MQKPEQVLVAVMGITGVGKTYFISKAIGRDLDLGNSLESSTTEIQKYELAIKDSNIILLDTPGFDDRHKLDIVLLEEFVTHLQRFSDDGINLAGIIYLHRINDNRMPGSAQKNLLFLTKLCGDDFLKRVVLVTTMCDHTDENIGFAREETLRAKFWKPLTEKEATMERFKGDNLSATGIVHELLQKLPLDGAELDVLREIHAQIPVSETKAGRVLMEDKFRKLDQLDRKLDSLREKRKNMEEKGSWGVDELETEEVLMDTEELGRERKKLWQTVEKYNSDGSCSASAKQEEILRDSPAEARSSLMGLNYGDRSHSAPVFADELPRYDQKEEQHPSSKRHCSTNRSPTNNEYKTLEEDAESVWEQYYEP